MTRLVVMGALLASPVFASETQEDSSDEVSSASESYGLLGDYEVVLAHPGRKPHPNPHRGYRRWSDGRRHGGHFGATARVSFAYHQALFSPDVGAPFSIASLALGLEVRAGIRDSFSMSLLVDEVNAGVEFGYRRYLAGNFDRGLFVGANVGEWGVGVPDVVTGLFGDGVAGAKYTDRRGFTVEFGAGAGIFSSSNDSELMLLGFVSAGQSI